MSGATSTSWRLRRDVGSVVEKLFPMYLPLFASGTPSKSPSDAIRAGTERNAGSLSSGSGARNVATGLGPLSYT